MPPAQPYHLQLCPGNVPQVSQAASCGWKGAQGARCKAATGAGVAVQPSRSGSLADSRHITEESSAACKSALLRAGLLQEASIHSCR